MQLTTKDKKIKYLVYCLVILLASLLQNVSGLWFQIGSARCFFLLPVTITLGLDEDEKVSAFLGLFAGLLWDMVSAQHMGFNFIFFMLTCYISSAIVSYIFRPSYWVDVINSVIVSFLYCVLYWLLFVLTNGDNGSGSSFLTFYLPCFVYTAFMSLILCAILQPLKRKLNKQYKVD